MWTVIQRQFWWYIDPALTQSWLMAFFSYLLIFRSHHAMVKHVSMPNQEMTTVCLMDLQATVVRHNTLFVHVTRNPVNGNETETTGSVKLALINNITQLCCREFIKEFMKAKHFVYMCCVLQKITDFFLRLS